MKNKKYIIDVCCNSAYDEYLVIKELRKEKGLPDLSYETFIKKCSKVSEKDFLNWKKKYPNSKEKYLLCYSVEMFLKS